MLLGYGLAGRVFHAPLVASTPGLSLDAIVTSDPDRQAQARAAYPSARIYASADEAWAGGHDLAIVGTANVTHVPYATAALAAGLHVVLDKPIAPTADDAVGLARLAREADRLLIPFQNRRWDSDFLTVREVAESGRLGRVHRFESRIERMRVVPKGGWRDSTDPADMGGMLYDLGAHLIDQALALMGPVQHVTASVRSVRLADATDDDVVLLLEHASGAVSVLVASQVGAFPMPRFSLLGTRGGLRVKASDSQEAALVAGRVPGDGSPWGVEPEGTQARLRTFDDDSQPSEESVTLVAGRWPDFYIGVARAIAGEGEPPVSIDDVIADLRVMDAARESALTGARISLDPPAGHAASSTS